MNLEAVEQKCLSFLKQTSNPLVPVKTLWAHLDQDPETAGITEAELAAFLKWHELFRLLQPGSVPAPLELTHLLLGEGPFVILDTRMPTRDQVLQEMTHQVDVLIESLVKALDQARVQGDQEQGRQVLQLLARAQKLKQKLPYGAEKRERTGDDRTPI
jgi:hypothetical protein